MAITNTKYIISTKFFEKFKKYIIGKLYKKEKIYYIYIIPKYLVPFIQKRYITYMFSVNDVIRILGVLLEKKNG